MNTCIALIRGINVGRAKRIAMKDLRELTESLGHNNVRTLLNSGNIIFQTRCREERETARSIEHEICQRLGFFAAVVVITATDLAAIIHANPFRGIANDPTRYLVAFLSSPGSLAIAKPLLSESWAPDALAIGTKAAYLWCPEGVSDSRLLRAFTRHTANAATTRNWATLLKLQAAADPSQNAT